MRNIKCSKNIVKYRSDWPSGGPREGHVGVMLGSSWPLKGILRHLNIILTTKVNFRGGEPDLGSLREGGPRREKTALLSVLFSSLSSRFSFLASRSSQFSLFSLSSFSSLSPLSSIIVEILVSIFLFFSAPLDLFLGALGALSGTSWGPLGAPWGGPGGLLGGSRGGSWGVFGGS